MYNKITKQREKNMTANYKKHGRVDYIDHYISGRLRSRRLLLGYSQRRIADAVDITIQQVQKYEKGKNRISGGNLYRIGKILDVPVSYFFENVEDNIPDSAYVSTFESKHNEREIATLIKAYNGIACPRIRKKIIDLMAVLSAA